MKFLSKRMYAVVACVLFLAVVFFFTGYFISKLDKTNRPEVKTEVPLFTTDSTAPVAGSIFTGLFVLFSSSFGISLSLLILVLLVMFFYERK
jgi:hypothetical protein